MKVLYSAKERAWKPVDFGITAKLPSSIFMTQFARKHNDIKRLHSKIRMPRRSTLGDSRVFLMNSPPLKSPFPTVSTVLGYSYTETPLNVQCGDATNRASLVGIIRDDFQGNPTLHPGHLNCLVPLTFPQFPNFLLSITQLTNTGIQWKYAGPIMPQGPLCRSLFRAARPREPIYLSSISW